MSCGDLEQTNDETALSLDVVSADVLNFPPPDHRHRFKARQTMPMDQFIAETIAAFGTDADEILVEGAKAFRANPGPYVHALVTGFNQTVCLLTFLPLAGEMATISG
jgi:hypothetical protein